MKLKNKKSLVQGIGINDADYSVKIEKNKKIIWICPFYDRWKQMLRRCYAPELHKKHPCYIGCSVTPEWRYFSKFRLWMESQKWEGMQLDKDLLVKGNKVYGPDTCCFLPQAINTLFKCTKNKKAKKNLPNNVYLEPSGKYCVLIKLSQKKLYRKMFLNFKEAHIHALEKKIEAVEYAIISYPELDVRAVFALNREINEMQEQINIIQNSLPNLFDFSTL